MGGYRMKKLWGGTSLALAAALTLSGCGGGDSNAADDGSGTLTISAFISTPNQAPAENNRIYQKIQDELGVKLNMEFLVGDLQQKLGVMIAGGDYPDLITADTKLVAAGAVIPLEDLIEKYGPNLKKHYEKDWNRMKDSSDGHIYWLPNYGAYTGEFQSNYYSGPAFWIQKSILKDAGYPTPKTMDDYLKLIRDYAAKNPAIDGQPTIGFTTLASDWRTFPLLNPPEHLTGHPNDGGVVVDNGVASVFADKDISKQYYKELNGLYNEGLLDKEAFVQNYDQYLAKLSSGRVLGMFDQHWNFQAAEDTLISQDKVGQTYVGFPLVYDSSIQDHYLDRPVINLNNGFGISKDAEDPERIIKFLDSLMDEKYQKLLSWGEEGVDYQVDDKGRFYRTPEQRKQQEDPAWKLANRADGFYAAAPKLEGTFDDGNASGPGNQPEEFYAGLRSEDKELLDAYGFKTWSDFFSPAPENPVYYPAWQIDLIEGSDASVANKQMTDASLKYLPQAVMAAGGKFDSVWEQYVKEFGKINVKAYEDRINEQIQWRIENWSTDK
ncbi:ABC transporter substrate-binding protein [Saccharibacillus sp. CPCC 101409]|uniref:ABC transporter substrate-binding protein n=1 Tax=Saccharibacillus sp. CPCC 101409 TaxID=3058041 RepID=UPI002673A7DE|nr:ABC transporter substrate-binding protein [Saccharibacillus sp. CPCC 101409]MDO3412319.1 ABC transporter substrate-binding protein [Saccharibacillus sp. CPCC 101409]